MSDVQVGSVWRDNDPRSSGRVVRVQAIADGFAICRTGKRGDGRATRIRLDRFRETRQAGYTLLG